MKSTAEQLQKRGYLTDVSEKSFQEVSYTTLLVWLNDSLPVKRTAAARRLGRILNPESIEPLCLALEKEKALYAKLELCNTLILFGKAAVPHLVQRLGKIDSKQYKAPPAKKFGKKNYPLPHDIFARTLMKIGVAALPELCAVLQSNDTTTISEAIDAIGYICFYDEQKHKDIANTLQQAFLKYADSRLIKWKLIRAMSAFSELLPFLEQQYLQLDNKELKQEAERSIEILKTKRP